MKDEKNFTPFYLSFLKLCKSHNPPLSPTAAAKIAGISSGAPTAWKNDGAIPKPAQRSKLCELFGVTDDVLLGYEQKETPAHQMADGENYDDDVLLEAFHNADDTTQELIRRALGLR